MKGLTRSLRNSALATRDVVRQTVKISAVTVAVANGAPGFGTAVIGGLPQGNILLLGATSYLQFTTVDTDVTTTFDGDYAIGTAPTADNALSGGEVNVIPSTALGAATARVSPVVRGASTANGVIHDNTDGSLELNLNLLIDDAAISGAADFTVSGTVTLAYILLGDD